MARLIADAGVLVAADRNARAAWVLKKLAGEQDVPLVVPAPVLAQVWRGPGGVNLARFLKGVAVPAFDQELARLTGNLLGVAQRSDVVDAAVVAYARAGDRIVTGDVEDISRLVELRGLEVAVQPF